MDQPTEKQILLTYLEEVLSVIAPKLVGKIMKRFEIIDDKTILKKETKELIYETFRELQDIFYAYSQGLEITQFKFMKK